MISTVLVCPPKYYQIEYQINPWMHKENKVDYKRVKEEFEALVAIYKKLGLTVLQIDPQPGLPDMVYAANYGFVIDNIFIRSNFRYPQRRKEAYFAEEFFKTIQDRFYGSSILDRSFKIERLPDGIFFEGQGDMFYRDGKFFCGYGKRTNRQAISYLEKILGEKIITLEVNDPYYYHLDTCFAPIGGGKVVIKPSSFKKADVAKIKKNFKKVIEVEDGDHPFFCCNIVATDGVIVAGKGIGKDAKRTFEKEGYEVVETPMSEFFKGGGSVKCLTLEFFRTN